jgi:DNA-binding Xre family transcriptional regulator
MSQTNQLIGTLKQELRKQRINYRQVAEALDLSEASVKRMFAGSFFTLERLEKICDLVNMGLDDLVAQMKRNVEMTTELTLAQEKELVSDIKLLLMAHFLINHLEFSAIIEAYEISETEGIRLLARLDRMKIIELQPGTRVRLLISTNFKWLPNGPIQRFFEQKVQSEFFDSSFDRAGEIRLFLSGMLSTEANAQTIDRIKSLAKEFNELVTESKPLPPGQYFGTSLLIAMRPWEVEVFSDLRRTKNLKSF